MTGKYLGVLAESLDKKILVLSKIRNLTLTQKELLAAESLDIDAFDRYVDEKDALIKELGLLDEGFEVLYEKVKAEVEKHKEEYKDEIHSLQEKIKEVTDLSVSISTQEARNKEAVEKYFKKQRGNIGKLRKSNKAATDYYKSAYESGRTTSGFLDTKK